MDLLREMRQRRLFFDGGTGSLLQAQGLKAGELPEVWSITRPEVCVKLHRDYLEAGADIIKTNTFGANGLKFKGRENANGAEQGASTDVYKRQPQDRGDFHRHLPGHRDQQRDQIPYQIEGGQKEVPCEDFLQ